MSRGYYSPGGPAVGRILRCPQLKKPHVIDELWVNQRVVYVLRLLNEMGIASSQRITKHEAWTSHQLGEVVTRLRNGGYLVDCGRMKGEGILRGLSRAGEILLVDIERDIAGGAVPRGEHPHAG